MCRKLHLVKKLQTVYNVTYVGPVYVIAIYVNFLQKSKCGFVLLSLLLPNTVTQYAVFCSHRTCYSIVEIVWYSVHSQEEALQLLQSKCPARSLYCLLMLLSKPTFDYQHAYHCLPLPLPTIPYQTMPVHTMQKTQWYFQMSSKCIESIYNTYKIQIFLFCDILEMKMERAPLSCYSKRKGGRVEWCCTQEEEKLGVYMLSNIRRCERFVSRWKPVTSTLILLLPAILHHPPYYRYM